MANDRNPIFRCELELLGDTAMSDNYVPEWLEGEEGSDFLLGGDAPHCDDADGPREFQHADPTFYESGHETAVSLDWISWHDTDDRQDQLRRDREDREDQEDEENRQAEEDAEEVLNLWQDQWGQLSEKHRASFLGREEVPQLAEIYVEKRSSVENAVANYKNLNKIFQVARVDWQYGYRFEMFGNLVNANLSGGDLRSQDLRAANLANADMRDVDLRFTSMRFAILSGVNLSGADLRGADLRGADLRCADLSHANLTDANLYNADLTDADLSNADLTYANLSGADLTGANLFNANLSSAETVSGDQAMKIFEV